MADETDVATAPEVVGVSETPVKKTRVPRAKKVAAETAPAKGKRGSRRKRGELADASSAADVVSGKAPRAGKRISSATAVGKRGPKALAKSPSPASTGVEELSDLLALEEENQRLRKSLAEKLRAENADLKKRLGL